MPLYAPFIADLVDASAADLFNAPALYTLGNCILSYVDYIASVSYTNITDNPSYMSEHFGGTVYSQNFNAPATELVNSAYIGALNTYGNFVNRPLPNIETAYKLRFTFNNGYKAIAVSSHSGYNWASGNQSFYLYDNNGTQVGDYSRNLGGVLRTARATENVSEYTSWFFSVDITDGVITSIRQLVQLQSSFSTSPVGIKTVISTASTGTVTSAYLAWVNAIVQATPPEPPGPGGDDPYEEIPESGPGGGGTDPDFTSSDVVDYPVTPTLSAVSTGFTSLWCPTEDQLDLLAKYLWNSDILTTAFWAKIFSNPLDTILGLNIVPLTLVKDGTDFVCLGGMNTWIRMDYIDNQFVEIDCGEIDLVETWGAYLDYDPYTRLEIYLPYCGTYPLKIDDFMPGKISVLYKADLMTGACVAMIKSTKSDEHGDTLEAVMYQFTGNIATSIPVTATQFTNVVRSAISFVAGTGQRIASAYSSFSSGVATTALATQEDIQKDVKFNPPKNKTPSSTNPSEIMSGKPTMMRSGLIGSACGLLSIQTPYLILTRPRQARPQDQNKYTGYPSFITETLGDLSGYTEVESIHLEGIPCTAQELNEIDALLKGGVIF